MHKQYRVEMIRFAEGSVLSLSETATKQMNNANTDGVIVFSTDACC